MRAKIGKKTGDSEKEPILLVFRDNAELISIIQLLTGMLGYDSPTKVRKITFYPDTLKVESIKKFMDSFPPKPNDDDNNSVDEDRKDSKSSQV